MNYKERDPSQVGQRQTERAVNCFHLLGVDVSVKALVLSFVHRLVDVATSLHVRQLSCQLSVAASC